MVNLLTPSFRATLEIGIPRSTIRRTSFDIRDWATDLELLQQAKASNIKSSTFNKELDKQIARTVIDDDETLVVIDSEIEQNTQALGEFPQQPITLPTV